MKVIYLTNNKNTLDLADWLKNVAKEEVAIWNKKIRPSDIIFHKPEFIISYNYKFIIKKDVINLLPDRIINLHISYLPYNKGANPNLWSFLQNTVKGVSIHLIDKGIDTGDILLQKKIEFDESKETFTSSYRKLNFEIKNLFKKNWPRIKRLKIKPKKQKKEGTYHFQKEADDVKKILGKNFLVLKINQVRQNYLKSFKIRKVKKTDISDIYRLSNEKEIRMNSFNVKKIDRKKHRLWFYRQLSNSICKKNIFLVTEHRNTVIAQLRLNFYADYAIISISVNKNFRGLGIGKRMLEKAIIYLKKSSVVKIVARIKENNITAIKFFESVGFKLFKKIKIRNITAFEYYLHPF